MKIATLITLTCTAMLLVAGPALSELDEHLEGLKPLIGKTFEGRPTDETKGQTIVDVQTWEVILGGKAVRSTHSVNEGEYGGETTAYWDPAAEAVAFYYITTAGFMTHGTITFDDGGFTTIEKAEGMTGGVTEVRGNIRIRKDGGLLINSKFLQDGEWKSGGDHVYVENPEAKVVFQ